MTSDWLREAVVTARVDRVTANMGAAGERITDARRHVGSTRSPAESFSSTAVTN